MMTLEQYARDYLNPAMRELDPAGYRDMDVDEAVREGLRYWADRYGSQPDYLASQIAAEPHGILAIQVADAACDAWREKHT